MYKRSSQWIILYLLGAAQWDSDSAQWFGGLVWTELGRPERRPDPTSSSQGEAERHVPLSVRLLDHSGQHTEAAVHINWGNARRKTRNAQKEVRNAHGHGLKSTVIFSSPCAGHPVVRRRLLHLLLPFSLFFYLPSRLPPSNPPITFPGCALFSHRAGRRGAPGSLDPDSRALPEDCGTGQTPVSPVWQDTESEPREVQNALCQQPVGPDGSWRRGRLGVGSWRRRRGVAVMGVPSISVQTANVLHVEDRRR